ncbi:MAG: alpha-methylacyl-CoA racemase, partial [Kiritimatiellia bacterium]
MLSGIRVLDLSRLLPGPACAWYLSGMGAVVDRVESVRGGDPTRALPPFQDGVSVFFRSLACGVRSACVDLRHVEGQRAIKRIVHGYDVLLDGFKPGVLERAGLGPSILHELNPKLVIARLSGFGQTGPWSQRPGHDLNYVGLAGLLHAAPDVNDLAVPSVLSADMGGALVTAMGVCAALVERERTGRGRVLDVSLTEAALSLHAPFVASLSAEGRGARPSGELLTGMVPVYGTYRCADGRWLTVGALEPKFQKSLQAHLGTVEREALTEVFATRSRDAWVDLLQSACVGPVMDIPELIDHPQLAARGALARVGRSTFVRPPFAADGWQSRRAPRLGEHTEEILRGGGVDLATL